MIGTGPRKHLPRRRAVGMLLAALGILATTEVQADAASKAIETSMMVGEIQALADICSPPESSYLPVVTSAAPALQAKYRIAGLDPGAVAEDIAQGKQNETARHDDPAWPLRCDLFANRVRTVQARLSGPVSQ